MPRSKNCPKCKSSNVEHSWGSEGYMQCNNCGHEWIQRKPKKLNWSKIGKLPKKMQKKK